MNQQENQDVLNQSWEIAQNDCDVTCPPEIVEEKAQEIFLELLVEDQN